MLMTVLGWTGSLVLSLSALPQAFKTFKTKETAALSSSFLWMWTIGEIFTFSYIISSDLETGNYQLPLYLNYGLNLIIVFYLLYAKAVYKEPNCLKSEV